MSYIGNTLPANFQSLPAVQRFNGDGSDTTFTLAAQIANDQSILVSVDGVTQDSNAYSVSGTTLTFTSAPSAGTGNIFVNTISPVGSTVVPPDGLAITATTGTFSGKITADAGIDIDNFNIDGTTIALSSGTMVLDSAGDIVLDADGTAVMFKDAGTEFGRIFNSSTDLVIKSIVSDKDMKFQGNDGGSAITALTLDMSAAGAATFNSSIIMSGVGSLTEVNGNFTVSGTDADHAGLIMATHAILPAEVGAEASANVIDLGANGNEFKSLYLNTSIITDSDLTLDVGGNIILDADGGDVVISDGGTQIAHLSNSNSDFKIESKVSDKDMIFRGNDGGSGITALTLDMSDEGAAIFNSTIKLGTNRGIYVGGTGAANYLSDYEEGSFTPSLGGNTSYNSQVGKYTKIGNMVTVWVNVYVNSIGTGSASIISGLPFTVSNIAEFNVNGNQLPYFATLDGTFTFVSAVPLKNGTTISFNTLGANGGTTTNTGVALLRNNSDIYFNLTYRTG